ncbi:MAG: hypothetical protein HQL36_01875 [Alphaproteobacteria bacterium]|nr:hypothetical protein [Alphaproteobacteria bacterium]
MRRFRRLRGAVPTFERDKRSALPSSLTGSDKSKKSYLETGASDGVMGAIASAVGDFGKSLIEEHRKEQKAAKIAYVQDMELSIEESLAKATLRHGSNVEAFDQDVRKMFGGFGDPDATAPQKFGGDIPEEYRPYLENQFRRNVLRNRMGILQRQEAEQKAQTNATLMDGMERSRTEALNAYRRGDVPMGADADGNPVAGVPEAEAKFRATLEGRTDLTPQQKQAVVDDYRRQRLEQSHLGALERTLDKEGVDAAGRYIEDFQNEDGGSDLDPTQKDRLVGEMRRRLALREREDREKLAANRGEAERIMRNGLARIETGEGEDARVHDRLLRLHPDTAERYRQLADRFKHRRGELEDLQTLPPGSAVKEWKARKPKADDPDYADKLDDWEAVGKGLEAYHRRMIEDPATTFAPRVEETIRQRTEPGGPLHGAPPEDVAESARDEAVRLMKEHHPGIRRVQGAMDGGVSLDPRDSGDRKAVDQYWRNVEAPAMAGRDPQARAAGIADFANKTGILPDDVKGYLRGAMRSGAPEDVARAADMLARLQDSSPEVLGDMDRKDIALGLEVADLMRAGVAPDQAVERAREAIDPANQAMREARKEGLKGLRSKYETWVKDHFDPTGLLDFLPFGPSNDTALSPDGGMKDQVLSDFDNLFEDWYLRTGNEETARKQAFQELRRVWGPSSVDGGQHAMRYPPEAFYGLGDPEADGEWMRDQLLGDLRQAGLPKDTGTDDLLLVPDARTARESATGKPTWLVMSRKDGAFIPFADKDGKPLRWRPDQGKAKQALVDKARSRRERRRSEEEARQLEIEIYGAPRSVLEQKGLL